MECLGLHSKPKAKVHPGHLLTGPKEEEEEEEEETIIIERACALREVRAQTEEIFDHKAYYPNT
jgi:hypothetical protein